LAKPTSATFEKLSYFDFSNEPFLNFALASAKFFDKGKGSFEKSKRLNIEN